VLVALVKLAHLAHIVPGAALWSFGGLILLLTAAVASFNTHELWSMVKEDE
jgi:paraquat-inducible protein A